MHAATLWPYSIAWSPTAQTSLGAKLVAVCWDRILTQLVTQQVRMQVVFGV